MTSHRLHEQHISYRRIVVKVGTNLLTAGTDRLDAEAMAAVAGQIAAIRELGAQVVLVSSGAISAGRHRLGDAGAGRDVPTRQALAAVGQSRLMSLWDELFDLHGVVVAQALLTRRDLADRLGYLNARTTLLALVEREVVPIVNENDVVSSDEIRDSVIGDNDNLSAEVANLVDADLLLILSDVAGLYTADPRSDATATLIEEVPRIDERIEGASRGQPGERGTGGMATKVQAARAATAAGVHVVIADGTATDIVRRAAAGEPVGTHFLPTADRVESRRRRLRSQLQTRGRIVIDAGAARALERDGKSLLPAGVVRVEGDFQRGDVVRIVTTEGNELASGSANYSSADIEKVRGKRSDRIADLLGYEYGEEVVHRNNLVLIAGSSSTA
jgi:glutamate 5-kinase